MTTPVLTLYISIISFMVVGTLIVVGIYMSARERHRDLIVRTLSWYPVSLFFMGGMSMGRVVFTLLFVWVSWRALQELLGAHHTTLHPALHIACGAAIVVHYALMLAGAWWACLLWLPIIATCALPMGAMLLEGTRDFVTRASTLAFFLLLSGWAMGMIPLVCWLPIDLGAHGWLGALMFILTITQLNDLFQYVWGKIFGRSPMAPNISPGKTWEGTLGGGLTMTTIGAILGATITPFGWLWGAVIAGCLCIGGVLGDLTVSAIKRDMDVKDLGDLLPGFGGLLDRVDSLILNAPAFVALLLATRLTQELP